MKLIINVVILAVILFLGAVIVLMVSPDGKAKILNLINKQNENTETVIPTVVKCANAGEEPIPEVDLRTGQKNTGAFVNGCCYGMKKISKKQENIIIDESGNVVCKALEGVPNYICAPCGNGSCNSAFEDVCNCPEDCQ